jgi:hypothetical protein
LSGYGWLTRCLQRLSRAPVIFWEDFPC